MPRPTLPTYTLYYLPDGLYILRHGIFGKKYLHVFFFSPSTRDRVCRLLCRKNCFAPVLCRARGEIKEYLFKKNKTNTSRVCVRLRRQVTFQALASCYTMGPTQTRMSRFFNSFILTFLYSIISTIVFFRRQSAEIGAGRRGSYGNITNTSGPVGTRPSPNNNMDAPSAGPSGTMHNHVYPVKQSNFVFKRRRNGRTTASTASASSTAATDAQQQRAVHQNQFRGAIT